jgi:hypothetical protein
MSDKFKNILKIKDNLGRHQPGALPLKGLSYAYTTSGAA